MQDFTYDYNESNYYGANKEAVATANNQSTRPASLSQVAAYRQLCERKNVVPQDTSAWSSDQASAEIQKLIDFKPASPAQLTLIRTKLARLTELEVPLNIAESDINALTGGRDGTASKLIEQLIELERKYSDRMSVTENQVRSLVSWYLCPDMPFEEFNIPLTLLTGESVTLNDGSVKQLWRRLTPVEFATAIQTQMNFQSAGEFINRYRSLFHDWKKTRIKLRQMELIRKLENRLADVSHPKIVDIAIDLEGQPVMIQLPADRTVAWNPDAYVPIGEQELMMYDSKQASRLIAQLESELNNRELVKFSTNDGEQDAFELLRSNPTQDKLHEREVEALTNSIFSLMSVLGQREHDFEHGEPRIIVERWANRHIDTQVEDGILYLEEMMVYAIDNNFITQDGLLELVQKSAIATVIASANW